MVRLHVPLWTSLLACTGARAQSAQSSAEVIATALLTVPARAEEQRWLLIPWWTSLTEALGAAKASGKPVFLFAYDGTLADGNC